MNHGFGAFLNRRISAQVVFLEVIPELRTKGLLYGWALKRAQGVFRLLQLGEFDGGTRGALRFINRSAKGEGGDEAGGDEKSFRSGHKEEAAGGERGRAGCSDERTAGDGGDKADGGGDEGLGREDERERGGGGVDSATGKEASELFKSAVGAHSSGVFAER